MLGFGWKVTGGRPDEAISRCRSSAGRCGKALGGKGGACYPGASIWGVLYVDRRSETLRRRCAWGWEGRDGRPDEAKNHLVDVGLRHGFEGGIASPPKRLSHKSKS